MKTIGMTRASIPRVIRAKNVFLRSLKIEFFGNFVEHLMPEILVQNLSGSKHFDPGFAPIEN